MLDRQDPTTENKTFSLVSRCVLFCTQLKIGGGFGFGNVQVYFPMLLDLHEKLSADTPLDIFFLEYSRTPAATHPVQLREAVCAYQHLLQTLQIDPSKIILGGDSAGAMLVLQLLQHIQTPHPSIPIKLPPNSRPSSCIFVSPWLELDQAAPAYTSNALYDLVPTRCVKRWATQWAGARRDEWTAPLKFQRNWRDIVPPCLVMSGEQEILIDDIKHFCSQLKEVHPFIPASANSRVDAVWLKSIDGESRMIGGGEIILCTAYLITLTRCKVIKCWDLSSLEIYEM